MPLLRASPFRSVWRSPSFLCQEPHIYGRGLSYPGAGTRSGGISLQTDGPFGSLPRRLLCSAPTSLLLSSFSLVKLATREARSFNSLFQASGKTLPADAWGPPPCPPCGTRHWKGCGGGGESLLSSPAFCLVSYRERGRPVLSDCYYSSNTSDLSGATLLRTWGKAVGKNADAAV